MPIWYRKSTGSEDRARAATPHRAPGLLPFPKRHYLLTKIGRMIVLFLAFIFLSYLLPGDSFGGATVVNDLVFTSVLSGLILALDRETGETVWTYQAPGAINGWPAFVEDKLIIRVGFGDPPVLLALELLGDL